MLTYVYEQPYELPDGKFLKKGDIVKGKILVEPDILPDLLARGLIISDETPKIKPK